MWKWLCTPFRPGEAFTLFCKLLTLHMVWAMSCGAFASVIDGIPKGAGAGEVMRGGWSVVIPLALTVLVEEVVRLLPLAIVAAFAPRPVPVAIATVITAAAFGAIHVSNGLPLWFALICQGGGGMIFNIAYLKCRGLPERRSNFALAYAWSLHLTFDLILLALATFVR